MKPEELKYNPSHEWVGVSDDGLAVIGITDFAVEQLTDLVIRLEARLRLQEQKTLTGAPSSRHQHRPVEISNFDNDVLRVVRGRCSVSQFGSTYTLTCR